MIRKEMFIVERIDFSFDTGDGLETIHLIPNDDPENGDHLEISAGDINLLQFTGLKDKEGTDIFEGDIVRCAYWRGKVVWCEDTAGFCVLEKLKGNVYRTLSKYFASQTEVIGNIKQNPELLEATP